MGCRVACCIQGDRYSNVPVRTSTVRPAPPPGMLDATGVLRTDRSKRYPRVPPTVRCRDSSRPCRHGVGPGGMMAGKLGVMICGHGSRDQGAVDEFAAVSL